MNPHRTAIYYHVNHNRVPDDKEFCEQVEFSEQDDETVHFKLALYGLELVVFFERKHTARFLDKLNAAIGVCEDQILASPDKPKEGPTSSDATDIQDPPDMGMDDRSRED